ncbi:MAG: rhodanese-like domain-containing protein [Gammaproteobacteria bacterium]|nr:rhodanese-like domain-containing protein [Gammaproteobacteria bacterium]
MIRHPYQIFICRNSMLQISLLILSCLLFSTSFADEGFPGRKIYPKVQTLSIEQLYEKIKSDDVIVVDVRSEYEYQTLKVLNAINIPVAKKSFPTELKKLREGTEKDIVFYCNGRSCYKSYKAGIKALNYNVKNCFSYDAGVFEWALAYPEQAVLLTETPVAKERIISKEEFKSRQLAPKEFSEKSLEENSIIYDIRDREQRRGGSGLFMFRDKNVELANINKLNRLIKKAVESDTTLYFYDQKGKQVRWLQYTLESQGLKNYYFMKGGAAAYYDMLRQEQI